MVYVNKICNQSKEDKIRIADWLISNTMLTIKSISMITGLDEFTVRKIFNDELTIRHSSINPIENDLIEQDTISFWEACPDSIAEQILRMGIKAKTIDDIKLIQKAPNIITKPNQSIYLSSANINEIINSKIYSVRLAKVFYLSHGHNAWHGVWSSLFYKEDCVYISYDDAKKALEKQRTQGRTFTIEELLALCFYTDKGIVLLIGINNQYTHPFRHIDDFNTVFEFIENINKIQLCNEYTQYLIVKYKENIFLEEIANNDDFYTYSSSVYNGFLFMNKRNKSVDFTSALLTKSRLLEILDKETNKGA